MQDEVIHSMKEEISNTLSSLKIDLAKLRTGRANTSMLDGIRVDYYGTPTPLNQCVNMTIADARMIVLKPWDKGIILAIEKAIREADLGINPQNDGEIIRLPIPSLTEERRKAIVKQAKGRGEDAKISLRNHRRDANDMLKELEKDKSISQDDLKRALETVDLEIKTSTTEVDSILSRKEKEILEL